jgi:hypothetical protein
MKYSIPVSVLCAKLILALTSCGNGQQPEKVITIDSVVRRLSGCSTTVLHTAKNLLKNWVPTNTE